MQENLEAIFWFIILLGGLGLLIYGLIYLNIIAVLCGSFLIINTMSN
jgi:lipid-A-disaccharide synthase-like uncharacterized protein